jgi:hypothetical protein
VNLQVYHDLDGIETSLFFYKGEWLLSSRWSADASQPLIDILDRRKGKHHNPFTFLEEQLQDACEGMYRRTHTHITTGTTVHAHAVLMTRTSSACDERD